MIFVSFNRNTTDNSSEAGAVLFLGIQIHAHLLVVLELLNL
jgi:hypothetical protein